MQTQIIEVQTIRHGMPGKTSVVQNDSARILKCIITDFVIPPAATARIYARKPSGAVIYNNCTIINNTVEAELTNQMLAETGVTYCQIELTEAGKTLTSFEFQLDVKRQLKDNKAIESSNEFTALENALNYYLPVEGETVIGHTSFNQGIGGYTLGSSASHGKGQAGWQYAFQITTTGIYQNQFLEFSITQRKRIGKLYIKLTSSSTVGMVGVDDFYTTGNIQVSYVCSGNVLDVYIQKSEAYDEIDCLITQKGSYMSGTVITWIDTVVSSLPDGAVAALYNTNNNYFTANTSSGTALILDNSKSSDDRTYLVFRNKGVNAGYLSMSGNDLYTYKNKTKCKVLDSENYTYVIADYMKVFEVKDSIKLKVPVAKTTDATSYYAANLNHVIKAENDSAVVFLNKQISTSASNISYRNGGASNISAAISNIYGENYVFITFTNKSTTSYMFVEFSNNSNISVESIS